MLPRRHAFEDVPEYVLRDRDLVRLSSVEGHAYIDGGEPLQLDDDGRSLGGQVAELPFRDQRGGGRLKGGESGGRFGGGDLGYRGGGVTRCERREQQEKGEGAGQHPGIIADAPQRAGGCLPCNHRDESPVAGSTGWSWIRMRLPIGKFAIQSPQGCHRTAPIPPEPQEVLP